MEAAQKADPRRKREEVLGRERVRLENSTARLVTAYQEELLTLSELRQRMPPLRKQQQAIEAELHSLEMAAADQSRYLQLAETLDEFRVKLRARAETLEVGERQKILRLLVKEILVSTDRLTIRHSIPIPPSGSGSSGLPSPNTEPGGTPNPGCLLRSGSHHRPLRRSHRRLRPLAVLAHPGPQPLADQPEQAFVGHPVFQKSLHPFVAHMVKGTHDTLPTISTFRNASSSRVLITRSKDSLWRSFGKPACQTACSSCSFYPTAVSR